MRRFAVLANDPDAFEVADKTLHAGGSALTAALTGFFFAAGKDPAILFSPLSILVGGVGAGVFAYDGRTRQPGLGGKRPRGFVADAEVSDAARASVPASVVAAAIAVAFHPGTTLLPCVRAGVVSAKSHGALGRVQLLEKVASLGATVLSDPPIRKAFLTQFGPLEQGLISSQDLSSPEGINLPAQQVEGGWQLPWNRNLEVQDQGSVQAIVAADARGLLVALCYGGATAGLTLSPYQVTIPSNAMPVMRGVPRLAPGTPLQVSHDLRLKQDARGAICGVSALESSPGSCLRLLRLSDSRDIVVPREEERTSLTTQS